jgi:hypothetical protein
MVLLELQRQAKPLELPAQSVIRSLASLTMLVLL